MPMPNSPFDDAVVPVPSGAPSGGGTTGGVPMDSPGQDPLTTAFWNAIVPTPGTSETPNASGITRVDRSGIDGSDAGAARDINLETPSKNLAAGG